MNLHEYVLCYAKDLALAGNFYLPPDQKAIKYYKYKDRHFEQRGPYRLQPLATTSMDERPNLRYPIISRDGTEIWPEKQWQWSEDRVKEAVKNDELVITNKNGKYTVSYK